MEGIIITLLVVGLGGLSYAYWQKQTAFKKLREHVRELQNVRNNLQTQVSVDQTELNTLSGTIDAEKKRILFAELLADSTYDILFVVDPKNNIVSCNEMAQILFEIPKSGGSLPDLEGFENLASIIEHIIDNEEKNFEEQIAIDEFTYRVRTKLIKDGNEVFVGIALQDITQLIRLNRARRDMVANISHELRTPIANIRLIIDSLFHDHDKPKRKESISSLRSIARETDALLWLVQEMADLSMIESGQAIVRMIEVPLTEVVTEAIERLSNQSEAKNITFVRQLPEKIHVLCDRDLIQRVIVNLLHNAMKWSPQNESVTISAVAEQEEVIISVLDNGPGVSEDQVERIFERFYQVDASRSGHDGTGLGLAICKHIVVAHGGRIWAESNSDGSGGRFRFTLLNVDVNEISPLETGTGSTP